MVYDDEGQPFSVRYHLLAPMLLNEVQKQHHKIDQQAAVIAKQVTAIEHLTARLEPKTQLLLPATGWGRPVRDLSDTMIVSYGLLPPGIWVPG